jgi:hypothetical protein
MSPARLQLSMRGEGHDIKSGSIFVAYRDNRPLGRRGGPARAEGGDPAALAAAMEDATASLQAGLKVSERDGTPISAKFEIEDGKLQLSIYTMKGDEFKEVVADPKTGAVIEAQKITDADDLKAAAAQKAAMAKATGHCSPPPMPLPRPMRVCGWSVYTRSCRTVMQWPK